MEITLRLEQPRDFRANEEMTREAFWDVYQPGCTEHLVLNRLRAAAAFLPALCFVAMDGERLIGSIAYSRAKVVNENGKEWEVLCLGPLGVLPEVQKTGIGSRLIRLSLDRARELGFSAVAITGNPKYYSRFGFQNAERFGIQMRDGGNYDFFMALELKPGALDGVTGRFYEASAFEVSAAEAEEFDKSFPPREKHVTNTQLH